MICSNCRRRLKADATSCLCGKFGAESQTARRAVIACCFVGCPEGAICRVFAKTGWANICRTHYTKVELSDKTYAPPSLQMINNRKIYEDSPYYRRIHGGDSVPGQLGPLLPQIEREPGVDDDLPLGIGRDELEQEFMDKAQP